MIDQPLKTKMDWLSQAAWLLGALIGGPMLFAREYPAQGVLVIVVCLGSVAWIEYVARTKDKARAALIAAGVVGALIVTSKRNPKD